MFHSNELALGTSPYSRTAEDLRLIKKKILYVMETAAAYGFEPIKISDLKMHY